MLGERPFLSTIIVSSPQFRQNQGTGTSTVAFIPSSGIELIVS
jgi:hypothetical protein